MEFRIAYYLYRDENFFFIKLPLELSLMLLLVTLLSALLLVFPLTYVL